jgi:hypothetical protein
MLGAPARSAPPLALVADPQRKELAFALHF